jgi:hypothetical protein
MISNDVQPFRPLFGRSTRLIWEVIEVNTIQMNKLQMSVHPNWWILAPAIKAFKALKASEMCR